jgi:uncharacterized membrane protein
MEAKAKILGHPIHQMLVVFPLGLLATSLIFDILYLVTGDATWTMVATYLIGAGIIGGLIAAVFGIVDWIAIPDGTRAKSVGLWHGAGNVLVVLLFIASWFIRLPAPGAPVAILLSFVAVAVSMVTAWLGGELVDRLGVGVSEGAHLDAPSSLQSPGPGQFRRPTPEPR